MTTTTTTTTSSLSATRAPSSGRLLLVELRKLLDTRSGVALLVTGALLAGGFGGGAALYIDGAGFGVIARMAGIPLVTLLPVFGALLATSGRQHRTSLTTYTMVPTRGRILAAQVGAVMVLALIASAATLLAAAMIVPVASALTGTHLPWTADWPALLVLALGMVFAALAGYAVGLATGSAPIAITILLAWPTIALLLGAVPSAAAVLEWLDRDAVAAFSDGATWAEAARAATGAVLWIVAPGVVGVLRELNSEVK